MTSVPGTRPVAVLFDAADTLIELSPGIPRLLSTEWLGAEGAPSPAAVREALWAIGAAGQWPDDEADPEARLAMWARFCRQALVRAGGADSEAAALRAARYILDPANYRRYDDVEGCLDLLRAAGHQLGLVSNFDPWLRDILEATGLATCFDTVVISSEVGTEKPAPGIFSLACERLGRPAGECLFIGDSVVIDVDGARGAGLHPVLLDRYDRFPGFAGPRIETLEPLPGLAAQVAAAGRGGSGSPG